MRTLTGYMAGTFFGVGVLLVIGGIVGLSALAAGLRAWQRRQPDPAWQAQNRVQKFTGYDQEKAVAAKHRALELEKSTRKLAAARAVPHESLRENRTVVRMDKKRDAR